jgi:hypothetical protein
LPCSRCWAATRSRPPSASTSPSQQGSRSISSTNSGGGWKVTPLDSAGDLGRYAALALDAGDHVHIAYYDYSKGNLKHATNRSGGWVFTVADAGPGVGGAASLALDAGGTAHISYLAVAGQRVKYVALCP